VNPGAVDRIAKSFLGCRGGNSSYIPRKLNDTACDAVNVGSSSPNFCRRWSSAPKATLRFFAGDIVLECEQ
jgi:hypothetical protein